MAVIILLLCSCSGNDEISERKSADMLYITNTDSDFLGCKSRLEAVISAMTAKVTVLENAHNNSVKINSENEYFLEKDYILTVFEPFSDTSLDIADNFNSELDENTAKTVFASQSNGMNILYDSDGESYFDLQMISEVLTKQYYAEYNEKNDSFRYIHSLEDTNGEYVEEFLEFEKTAENSYIIQSDSTRCYIEFNEDGEILYFCCGQLRDGSFSFDESFYEEENAPSGKSWVLARGKSQYSNIHTFENGVLTHEDCSSGPWKSVKIVESDFASAFLRTN